jgi:hypothetical protein
MGKQKSWSDLTGAQQAAIVVGAAFELVLTGAALRDLLRRPSGRVRGPKLLWVASFVVQPFGPIGYFLVGRKGDSLTG